MTEPAVASSDATNIECQILRDGDEYVINGRKWFSSGFSNERCKIGIVMGKSDPHNKNRHQQQSMILVPKDTPGMTLVRDLTTFGYKGMPGGHPEIDFNDVRVPATNMLLGEGRGFEMSKVLAQPPERSKPASTKKSSAIFRPICNRRSTASNRVR